MPTTRTFAGDVGYALQSKEKTLSMQYPFDIVFFQNNYITLSVDYSFDQTLFRNNIVHAILSWYGMIHYFSSFDERVTSLDNPGGSPAAKPVEIKNTISNLAPPHAHQTPQNIQNKTRHILYIHTYTTPLTSFSSNTNNLSVMRFNSRSNESTLSLPTLP
mmetsp:Transcript_12595/g.23971  ORF Transcript_12595/g.23971 Transcript_12595/m.23971 type:complete len:160 (+) Transcript_12595:1727-2206(+)